MNYAAVHYVWLGSVTKWGPENATIASISNGKYQYSIDIWSRDLHLKLQNKLKIFANKQKGFFFLKKKYVYIIFFHIQKVSELFSLVWLVWTYWWYFHVIYNKKLKLFFLCEQINLDIFRAKILNANQTFYLEKSFINYNK